MRRDRYSGTTRPRLAPPTLGSDERCRSGAGCTGGPTTPPGAVASHEAFISLEPKQAPAGRWWRSRVRLLGWPAGLIAFVVAISSYSEWRRGANVLVPFAAALLALPYALSRTRGACRLADRGGARSAESGAVRGQRQRDVPLADRPVPGPPAALRPHRAPSRPRGRRVGMGRHDRAGRG